MRFSQSYTLKRRNENISDSVIELKLEYQGTEPEAVATEDQLLDSDIDNMAHAAGWLVLSPEEAYEKCLSHSSSVYILKEDDLWVVWRGSWISGSSTPNGQKTLAKTPSFQHALHRGESYAQWRLREKDKNKEEDKGCRAEREFARLIGGERVPLSGAAGGSFRGDVRGLGITWEVKVRRDGFKQLYGWLEKSDALAVKADRKRWLVVMPIDRFMSIQNITSADLKKQGLLPQNNPDNPMGISSEKSHLEPIYEGHYGT